jgi:S-adenosylmethionine hydrolase
VKCIRILGREITGVVRAYGERPSGELIALYDSSDLLSIAVVNGNAAETLQAKVGDAVEVSLSSAGR